VVDARVKGSGALSNDRLGDRDHLGIEIAFVVAKLRRPNLVCGAQREQRHSGPARFDQHHPLAPAECQPADAGDTSLGHCGTDHSQRFHRDRTIEVKVVRTVEINGIDVATRHEALQIYDLSALDIERLQLLGGECNELAAAVFVSLDDFRLLDFFPGPWVVWTQRDPGGLIRSLNGSRVHQLRS